MGKLWLLLLRSGVILIAICSSFDGKAKVWSIDQKACVATHSESEHGLFAVRWLPRVGMNEGFVTAGAGKNIAFYREAMGS